jgi:hypothetical protein
MARLDLVQVNELLHVPRRRIGAVHALGARVTVCGIVNLILDEGTLRAVGAERQFGKGQLAEVLLDLSDGVDKELLSHALQRLTQCFRLDLVELLFERVRVVEDKLCVARGQENISELRMLRELGIDGTLQKIILDCLPVGSHRIGLSVGDLHCSCRRGSSTDLLREPGAGKLHGLIVVLRGDVVPAINEHVVICETVKHTPRAVTLGEDQNL